uniref:Transmembrane protein n=1 Tax=Octopus bimaculoides TaxID=37653 RepID=A0A0L8I9Q2_OCTBM
MMMEVAMVEVMFVTEAAVTYLWRYFCHFFVGAIVVIIAFDGGGGGGGGGVMLMVVCFVFPIKLTPSQQFGR